MPVCADHQSQHSNPASWQWPWASVNAGKTSRTVSYRTAAKARWSTQELTMWAAVKWTGKKKSHSTKPQQETTKQHTAKDRAESMLGGQKPPSRRPEAESQGPWRKLRAREEADSQEAHRASLQPVTAAAARLQHFPPPLTSPCNIPSSTFKCLSTTPLENTLYRTVSLLV